MFNNAVGSLQVKCVWGLVACELYRKSVTNEMKSNEEKIFGADIRAHMDEILSAPSV